MIPTPDELNAQVRCALNEDIGTGDLTASLVPADQRAEGRIITREAAVFCGAAWADAVFDQIDTTIEVNWLVAEGDAVRPEQPLCQLSGPARGLLTAERTALNFLQTLSATATATRRLVDLIAGTGCTILDTRKTLPGLRTAQKYAVRCGGGKNHRIGLFDGILIKENHIAACGSIQAAVAAARNRHPGVMVEVEVESLPEVQQALDARADRLLLDNFSLQQLEQAVAQTAGQAELEASGGVTESELTQIAATGVDFISVGAITKHVRAVDLSMRLA